MTIVTGSVVSVRNADVRGRMRAVFDPLHTAALPISTHDAALPLREATGIGRGGNTSSAERPIG